MRARKGEESAGGGGGRVVDWVEEGGEAGTFPLLQVTPSAADTVNSWNVCSEAVGRLKESPPAGVVFPHQRSHRGKTAPLQQGAESDAR